MSDDKPAAIFPLIKETAGWVGDIASTIGIPIVPLVAKLIEKAPLGSFESWLRSRATGDNVDIAVTPDSTPPAPAADAAPPPPAIETKAFDVGELLRQYETIQHSEPFFAALTKATAEAVSRLEAFITATSILSPVASAHVGLWPLFTLEWKARRCLTTILGDSAAVSDVPELRLLIEAEVAGTIIDDIVASAAGGPDAAVALGPTVKLFGASKGYAWPKAQGLRPGYVIGYATRLDAMSSLIGGSPAAAPIPDQTAAREEGSRLTARLGELSVAGRDELTAAWIHTCEAGELSAARRAQRGLRVNPFLSRLEFPLLHVRNPAKRDAMRPDLDMIYAAVDDSNVFLDRDFFATLDELAAANGVDDADRFAAAERHIRLLTSISSGRRYAEPVKRIIETLRPAA